MSEEPLNLIVRLSYILAYCDHAEGRRIGRIVRVVGGPHPRAVQEVQRLVNAGLLIKIDRNSETLYKTTAEGKDLGKDMLKNIKKLLGRVPEPKVFPVDLADWMKIHDVIQVVIMVESAKTLQREVIWLGGVFIPSRTTYDI